MSCMHMHVAASPLERTSAAGAPLRTPVTRVRVPSVSQEMVNFTTQMVGQDAMQTAGKGQEKFTAKGGGGGCEVM